MLLCSSVAEARGPDAAVAHAQGKDVTQVGTDPNSASTSNQEPAPASPSPAPLEADDGKFKFGGAIRARYDVRYDASSLAGFPKTSEHFSFDTLALKASYDSSTIFGAAQYRFYGGSFVYGPRNGYLGYPGEVSFPLYAYLGYKFTPEDSLTVGINQVPFSLLSTFSVSFFETIGFTMGLEEVYNFGVKYAHVGKDLNYQFGFYPGASPNAVGISLDSARYSTNIVRADPGLTNGSQNREQNMFVGRVEYFPIKNDSNSFGFGASVWHSDIYNFDTGLTGAKQLEGVHFIATNGPWGLKGNYIRQDIDPKNPNGNAIISIGGYDSSYNMATHGNFVSAELTYKFTDPVGLFTPAPYVNYSAFFKDKSNFKTSERFMVGSAWTYVNDPNLIIYTEYMIGRNDAYVGSFSQGLAAGGDDRWKSRFYMNIGYYF